MIYRAYIELLILHHASHVHPPVPAMCNRVGHTDDICKLTPLNNAAGEQPTRPRPEDKMQHGICICKSKHVPIPITLSPLSLRSCAPCAPITRQSKPNQERNPRIDRGLAASSRGRPDFRRRSRCARARVEFTKLMFFIRGLFCGEGTCRSWYAVVVDHTHRKRRAEGRCRFG